jgi:predicted rRNA methylase YqxC with S4 and FtsJ domains
VAWTRQRNILPAAKRLLGPGGTVVTLIKPHYEAAAGMLRKGVLPEAEVDGVVSGVLKDAYDAGFEAEDTTRSPIIGGEGNVEVLARLRPRIDQR